MPKKSIQARGTLEAFNVSPKGLYEGLILRTANGLVQVNFPQEWTSAITGLVQVGNQLECEMESEHDDRPASHKVYRLIRLSGSDAKTWPEAEIKNNGNVRFSSKVNRLNYALHGEVNGAMLSSGDFLHTKPHGAIALKLKPGMKVEGTAVAKPAMVVRRILEPTHVNGIRVNSKPAKKRA